MGEFDILEYDCTLLNDNGLEMIIEAGRADYRGEFYTLTKEWNIYED